MLRTRWPDYFFGQVAHINELLNDGKFDQAHATLCKLSEKTYFHRNEFIGLCKIHVQYSCATRNHNKGLSWLMLLAHYASNDIQLEQFQRQLNRSLS